MSHRSLNGHSTRAHLADGGRGGVVVCLHGEIDIAAADEFGRCAAEAVRRCGRLLVDFSEATFMDSTGLAVLVRAYRELGEDGEKVVIQRPNAAVRRALETSGVGALLTVQPSGGS